MTSRLRWLIALVVVLGAGYGVLCGLYPEFRPSLPDMSSLRHSSPTGERPGGTSTTSQRYERVEVTVELLSTEEQWPWTNKEAGRTAYGCPMHQVSNILGVVVANPYGVLISEVLPGGPAEKAGIKPGDCLCDSTMCASEFLPRVQARSERREVKLTIRRPVQAEESEDAGDDQTVEARPGPSAPREAAEAGDR